MTNAKKTTKKEMFEQVKAILLNSPSMIPTEVIDFLDTEIASLDKKAAAAKASRDKKKAEADELTEQVFACLNSASFMTIPQIMKQFADNEDISSAKVTARLTKLVNAGKVEKDIINVAMEGEKAKKLTGYRVIA